MSGRITQYLRGNVLGFIAIFIALNAGAYAAIAPRDSVVSGSIKDGEVKAPDLAPSAATTPKIAAGAVTSPKLAIRAVTSAKLKALSVTHPKLAANAVGAANVMDNSLTGADIHESTLGAVPNADRLDNLDSSAFLGANAGAGGDLTGNYPNPKLASGAVVPSDLSASAAGASGIVDSGNHLSRSRNVASLTHTNNTGIYCIQPTAGIDPATAVMVATPDFGFDGTITAAANFAHVEWRSDASDCATGNMEVVTFLFNGDEGNTGDTMMKADQPFSFSILPSP